MSAATATMMGQGRRATKQVGVAGLPPQVPTPSVSEDEARGGQATASKKHVLRDNNNGRFTKRPRTEQEDDGGTSTKQVTTLQQQIDSLRKEVDQKNNLIIQLTGDLHMMAKDHEQEVNNLKRALKASNNFCEGYLKILLENKDVLATEVMASEPKMTIGSGYAKALDVM